MMKFEWVLDCVGNDFRAEWDRLHVALSSSDPDSASAAARATVSRWWNRSATLSALLPGVLLGSIPTRALQGFCIHGYCAAVERLIEVNGPGFLQLDGAVSLNETVQTCMGFESAWWPWNFLDDSRWAKDFTPTSLLRAAADSTSSDVWPLDRSLYRRHSSSELASASADLYLPEYSKQLSQAMSVVLPTAADCTVGGATPPRSSLISLKKPQINFAAFGVHLTTLLEPVSALRRVIEPGTRMAVTFYGASHPPPEYILPEVCPGDEGLERLFECRVSSNPPFRFWMDLVDKPQLKQTLGTLAAVVASDTTIFEADSLICGGGHSPTLCLMLRMVTGVPMYFTLQAPLSFRMTEKPDQRLLFVALFREMARPTPISPSSRGVTVVSTSLIFLQRQVWVQTGCLLPIVRNHNFYASGLAGKVALEVPEGLLPEVVFWQNHVSLKADPSIALWRFVKQTVLEDFPFRLVFKNVRGLPTFRKGRKVYSLREAESIALSYSDLRRRFAAAVLFPHDLGMISFDDLYALSIPIFMPDNEFVAAIAYAHLASSENYPWYLLREEHASLQYFNVHGGGKLPWDPGWGGSDAVNETGRADYLGRDAIEIRRIWRAVEVSNFALLPHVRRFRSIAALLDAMQRLGLQGMLETSDAMRRSSEDAWQVTSEFYRRAAVRLFADY